MLYGGHPFDCSVLCLKQWATLDTPLRQEDTPLRQEDIPHRQEDTHLSLGLTLHNQVLILPKREVTPHSRVAILLKLEATHHRQEDIHLKLEVTHHRLEVTHRHHLKVSHCAGLLKSVHTFAHLSKEKIHFFVKILWCI